MRKILFISILLALLSAFSAAPPKKFSVTIKQWGSLKAGNVLTRVTQDSVVVNGTNYDNEEFGYGNKLLPTQSRTIADAIAAIDMSTLKTDYTDNNASDDLAEFDFTFDIGGTKTKTHVYEMRVDELLDLVKAINKVLPDDMQVQYDDAYLKMGH